MIDLNALSVFSRVAETLSFSKAARQLRMPVSTLSRKIAELEGALGVQLIERTTRQLRMTEIGLEVLGEAQRAAEVGEAVDAIVSNRLTQVRGRVSLSAPPSIADSLLSPILAAFQAAHPGVHFRVLVTDRMVDHIAEGIDVALRVGELKDSSLVARPLLTYSHQLVASPAYLARHSEPSHPDELSGHRLLAFGATVAEHHWTFIHAGRRERISFEPSVAMNDYAGLGELLAGGAGIGDLPPIIRPELMQQGRLVPIMQQWRFEPVTISMVRSGQRYVPRPLRLFMDFLAARAASMLPNHGDLSR